MVRVQVKRQPRRDRGNASDDDAEPRVGRADEQSRLRTTALGEAALAVVRTIDDLLEPACDNAAD